MRALFSILFLSLTISAYAEVTEPTTVNGGFYYPRIPAAQACAASLGQGCTQFSGAPDYLWAYMRYQCEGGNVGFASNAYISPPCNPSTPPVLWTIYEYHGSDISCPDPEEEPGPGGLCTPPAPPSDCPAQGTPINLQFSPTGFPVSKGGCGVEQTGDSVCTGTADEGGYCVAPFEYTGTGMQDPDAVDDSAEWGGDGSTPDPEHTAAGAGSDGSTTTTTGTSSGSSTTTDNGDGTSTTVSTGTSESTTEETSNGTASASGSCGLPPVCSGGDPQLCAILRQEYHSMCSGEQVDPSDFQSDLLSNGLHDMDANDSAFGTGNTTDIDSDVVSALNAIDTTFSPATCPLSNEQITFAGVPFTLDVTEVCNFISIMAAIVRVLAGITAAWVLLSGLSRVD